MIRQASAELARGLTFRAVLRTLVAERTGQLAFDFQPARTDSQPAKVVTLRPRPRITAARPTPGWAWRRDGRESVWRRGAAERATR